MNGLLVHDTPESGGERSVLEGNIRFVTASSVSKQSLPPLISHATQTPMLQNFTPDTTMIPLSGPGLLPAFEADSVPLAY